jgi:light-regulated signal transduction histidine kinase (bacteriophytochrome)
VKSIVEAHGGRVEVETTPGEGSRFAIHVPAVSDDSGDSDDSDDSDDSEHSHET